MENKLNEDFIKAVKLIYKNKSILKQDVRKIYLKNKSLEIPLQRIVISCIACNRGMFRNNVVNRKFIEKENGLPCSNCALCFFCCSCENCSLCSSYKNKESLCSTCKTCDDCCECKRCFNCGTGDRLYCNECACCDNCCDCPRGDKVRFIYIDKQTFHEPKLAKERKINPSKRMIAAEIEIAHVDDDIGITKSVKKWGGGIVGDGSLPDGGFEINMAPAGGDYWISQVDDLTRALRKSNAKVTRECGLHVHVDARDFSIYDIRRLARFYYLIEPAIFAMVAKNRRNSAFCKPSGRIWKNLKTGNISTYEAKKEVIFRVYGIRKINKDFSSVRRDKGAGDRYKALNLVSYFYRGTVECRLFGGTTSKTKIANWGMLWARILDFVVESTDKEIESLKEENSYENLLLAIKKRRDLVEFVDDRIHDYSEGLKPHKIKSLDSLL